jgi:hypothetical protein
LGKIATPEAAAAIRQALATGPAQMRPAAANGALICAERQLADGDAEAAMVMYEAVRDADVPDRYKAAAEKGIADASEPGAGGMAAEGPPEIKAAEAKRLFDGKTFVGWEGDAIWFRVEDGAIVGGSLEKEIPMNKFLCATKEYDDFVLRLKVKLVENKGNAGIQFRSRRIPAHHEMIGYQADVGVGYWGKLYDESRRRKVLAGPEPEVIAEVLKPNDWNEYVIRCEGPRIQLWINGVETVDYTEEDESIPQKGLIGLQIHGGAPSEVWYKDIEIVELP